MVCIGVRAGYIHEMLRNQVAAGGLLIYVILPATILSYASLKVFFSRWQRPSSRTAPFESIIHYSTVMQRVSIYFAAATYCRTAED